jgi:hypothetical protein
VRIAHCGVCHSDLHIQDGFFTLGDSKQLDLREGRSLQISKLTKGRGAECL